MSTEPRRVVDYVYKAAHLAELGVTLDEFEENPQAALDSVGQYDALDLIHAGFRPLLPAQVRMRAQLERQWRTDGTAVERRSRTYVNDRRMLGLPDQAYAA
ncbi:hypothetical protein [Rhodanobacter sp. FW106-PBR-R2A-1-13]|uniref:hypothetical protein n=1 Tax=Rhodanobacter sp. FW106-PBR-R2A-1-13 TaxID=3454845 RepID=UPI0034E59008